MRTSDRAVFWAKPLQWTVKQTQAATLVAYDRLTGDEIAKRVGIHPSTLDYWMAHPDFKARVAAHRDAADQDETARGIARRGVRLRRLNALIDKLDAVIEARAGDPEMASEPGGDTGLLAREEVSAGPGRALVNYRIDGTLLKEMRELMKQAAIETGQWTEKRDVTSGGKSFVDIARALDLDE